MWSPQKCSGECFRSASWGLTESASGSSPRVPRALSVIPQKPLRKHSLEHFGDLPCKWWAGSQGKTDALKSGFSAMLLARVYFSIV